MSRVGAVTLLQVAAGQRIFLFDVQALGTAVDPSKPKLKAPGTWRLKL
jgi:hypothetical protein